MVLGELTVLNVGPRHSRSASDGPQSPRAAGFFSFFFFVVGFFTLGLAWIASVFFFLLFLYWGMGTNKFWRCTICGSLLPRG